MINIVVLSIPIYFLLIGIELLIQRFSRQQIYRLNDALTNISCGITQQLSGVFFKVLSVGAYFLLFEYLRIAELPRNWLYWIALFFAVDFCYYWAHRMSHEINLFWGGHVVHHQSEDYNFSVALRQSSFQVLWTFFFYLPLAILGFHPLDFVIVSALVTVYQFWIHTETIGKLGFLEKFLNTPSHHRVHHGKNPKYIDKNHAGVFIIWDKMFGTFQQEEERPTYGTTKPVNSWNPVWVNFEHYNTMLHDLKKIEGYKNKLKYIFYKPGWLPEEMGGPQKVPDVSVTPSKYNMISRGFINYYVLFQYLIILGGTAVFLFNVESLALNDKILITTLIVLSVVNCGALLEQRSWVTWTEISRVILISAGTAFYFYYQLQFIPFFLTISYSVISLSWLYYAYRRPAQTVKT
ncbi:MAG: sterol desaturase family protein [Candidatus Cyclobacteriaceae bacterium M2_1C_046]